MEIKFPVPFVKMSGTGNDFILIDHRIPCVPREEQPQFVRKICRRRFSVGADGVFFIEPSDTVDFRWRFYNADGSEAEMCGNGARCVARYAYLNNIAARKMSFETLAGIVRAEICEDDEVQVQLTPPADLRLGLSIHMAGKKHELFFINTGVPHAILFTEDEEPPVAEWGAEIRHHPMFKPEGTNVNFVCLLGENRLGVRTYERGVEEETRACGTGAVAAAIIASVCKRVSSPVHITTSGGESLLVKFELFNGSQVKNVTLTGPTRIIYEGFLTIEALL